MINYTLLILIIILFLLILFYILEYNYYKKEIIEIDTIPNNFCEYKEWELENINNDELSDYININNKIMGETFILDTNKENFNILEKYVYELANFHLKRLGKKYDPNIYKLEFWFKNEDLKKRRDNKIIHEFHIDRDERSCDEENLQKIPFLSTVTYLTNSKFPTLISNIKKGYDSIDKKNFDHNILLSTAKKNKHISFKGDHFHGVINFYKNGDNFKEIRKTFMINIWENHVPSNVKYLNLSMDSNYLKNEEYLKIKERNSKYLNYKFDNNDILIDIIKNFQNDDIRLFENSMNIDIRSNMDNNYNIFINNKKN
jgi:hypothetical protein